MPVCVSLFSPETPVCVTIFPRNANRRLFFQKKKQYNPFFQKIADIRSFFPRKANVRRSFYQETPVYAVIAILPRNAGICRSFSTE